MNITLIKEKNKTAKHHSKHPITYGETYKRLRNNVTNEIRNAKRIYFKDKFEQSTGNPKKTWKVINEVLKRKSKNKTCDEFIINDDITSDPSIIVDRFNEYFSTIGTELANKLPLPEVDFRSFLGPRNENNFRFDNITTDDVVRIVRDMKDCSSGCDEIPMKVLRGVLVAVITPLTHICNISLKSGVMPDPLKISRITPIHKSNKRNEINNYRPISILSVISKIIEKIVCNQLTHFFNSCSIFNNYQYGFRVGRSTESALNSFIGDILSGFDQGKATVAAFLDLSKAF